jgi:hypothetical protein
MRQIHRASVSKLIQDIILTFSIGIMVNQNKENNKQLLIYPFKFSFRLILMKKVLIPKNHKINIMVL